MSLPPITSFRGEYRFLSNFWPCTVKYCGEVYLSVEHAYQAAKSVDAEVHTTIRRLSTPGAAKRAGRAIEIRSDWLDVRLDIMEQLVRDKFHRDDELRLRLLATEDATLVEGNNWGDRFWGQCPIGVGQNHLGRILMRVRKNLN